MEDDDIICTCFDLSVKDIKEAIKNGATSIEEIGEVTEAGTLCGACIGDLETLLQETLK